MWEALTVCKGTLSKLEVKNENLRNEIEIMNIFRMYSFGSTIPTNSSLRPNMNPIRAVLRCIGPYKNNTYDLIHLPGRPSALTGTGRWFPPAAPGSGAPVRQRIRPLTSAITALPPGLLGRARRRGRDS